MARAKGTTTEETLTVNGVVLNTYAKNIESLTGRLRTPGKRTSNVVVPGRHGSIRIPGKKFDENVLALPMWVIGADDNGKVPTNTTARRQFYKNVDALTQLFHGADGPLDVRHKLPDGSVRQCFADVLDAIDFTMLGANPDAKFGVSLVVADAFWHDLDPRVSEQPANGAEAQFPEFAGATAPMEDLIIGLLGPWTNPVLTFSDGSWVAYDAQLLAGQGISINSGEWTLAGVGGFQPELEKLRYGGTGSRWASVPPPPAGEALTISLTGGTRTADTRLSLEGRRKFLVG
jgi:hypothetical protein